MGAYRLVIGCNMRQYETSGGNFTPDRYLYLDTISDRNITGSNQLCTQPMQSGDTITDHMYRNPTKVSVSGTFSLNGKNWNDISYNFIDDTNSSDRLTNIEHVFEKIKDEGILCTLTTIYEENDSKDFSKTRFITRKNMALENFSFVEKQNSLGYTFSFSQVIFVDTQKYEPLSDEEMLSLGLPNVNYPVASSLGTLLADTNQLKQIVIKALYENEYLQDTWIAAICAGAGTLAITHSIPAVITAEVIVSMVTEGTILLAAGIAVAAGIGVLGLVAGLAGTAAVYPVGTIIAGSVAGAIFIGFGIASVISRIKKEIRVRKAFKLVNGSYETDLLRLADLLDKIEIEVNKVKANIDIYSISENVEQQVILNIAGNFYYITFDKNNVDNSWQATVKDRNGNDVKGMYNSNWPAIGNMMDLNGFKNVWFKDDTKEYEVYLVCPAYSKEINKTQEEIDNMKKDLTQYFIYVSKGSAKDNVKKIINAINNAIESEGFI